MKKLLLLASILVFVCYGCKDGGNTPQGEQKASLTISIIGEGAMNKASDTPTQAQENTINSLAVLVYSGGTLERIQEFGSGLTQTVTELTTGLKKIVVLANLPASYTRPTVGTLYTDLATHNINLDDQYDWNAGLVMTGEASATLAAEPATNPVSVNINRIVAKVILGSITVNPPPTQDLPFVIGSVYITKARSLSNVGIPTTSPIGTSLPYYGGFSGMVVNIANVKSYLSDHITLTDFNRYYYVFANDNSDDNGTIMGISATYGGRISYFPFRINDAITGDGTFVRPNYQYTLNIVINNPGKGSPDPEKPSDPAVVTVTVTPQNWKVAPTSNVEW